MSRASLWTRICSTWAGAAVVLVAADPSAPRAPWAFHAAAPAGLGAGVALFLAAGGRPGRPRVPRVAALGVLALSAVAEEVLWRWFALGELGPALGIPAALGASAILFALAHRDGFAGRATAGAVFGGVYVLTGALVGACCAHVAYNLCAAASRPVRSRPEEAPA